MRLVLVQIEVKNRLTKLEKLMENRADDNEIKKLEQRINGIDMKINKTQRTSAKSNPTQPIDQSKLDELRVFMSEMIDSVDKRL